MREFLKSLARVIAIVLMVPRIVAFRIAAPIIGIDRALEGSTEAIARIPGIRGQYMRRLSCGGRRPLPSDSGDLLRQRDVLLAAGVHIPSGAHPHSHDDIGVPIREQHLEIRRVRIGAGTWIGSGAIVHADVGRNCVVAAGAVVTREIPDNSVAAGVPARVIKTREARNSA